MRAPNPGLFTLSGTNTWLVGRNPTHVIDPGPEIESHMQAIDAAIARRGGLGAVVLTHDHRDHAQSAAALASRHAAPVAGWRGDLDIVLRQDDTLGPLRAHATPGHAVDHLAFVAGDVCFTGDAVLGEGSVFIDRDGGGLVAYLDALRHLRSLKIEFGAPGHGPLITDVGRRIEEYIVHRLERERLLLAALATGARTPEELLNAAWPEVPPQLREAAGLTLAAHLAKLAAEGRLPLDVV